MRPPASGQTAVQLTEEPVVQPAASEQSVVHPTEQTVVHPTERSVVQPAAGEQTVAQPAARE